MRAQIQAMDRNLPITNVWPIGEVISQSLWASSFGASLLTVFAMIAMALCAVGIYGVVGYSVGQRIREFGIRLALGAQPRDVLLMVLKQSALIMGAGLVAGLVAAFLSGAIDCYVPVRREYQLAAGVSCHGAGAGGRGSVRQLYSRAPRSQG